MGVSLSSISSRFSSKPTESLRIQVGGIDDAKLEPLNKVRTTKYTLLTFIPLNFYEQFRRAVYFYYLVITIIAFFIPSTVSPMTSLIPLLFVMVVTALKEGREDLVRYTNDKAINTTEVTVLRNGKECQIHSEFINPGDLIVVYRDCEIPCDAIILSSSEAHGKCYINTVNLDGESNLKTLSIPTLMPDVTDDGLDLLGDIVCEQPTVDLYNFNGRIELQPRHDSKVLPLTIENLLLRGTTLKNTERVVGCAIYTGMTTKLQLNSRYTSNKAASSDKYINKYILTIIVGMFVCIVILFIMQRCDVKNVLKNPYYGQYNARGALQIFEEFIILLILFNYMVPMSVYINIEVFRVFGANFIRGDLHLYDEETDQPCIANASNLNEELGQINILFSDKTGTLTKNEMKFKECSINAARFELDGKFVRNVSNGESLQSENFEIDQTAFFEALSVCHTVDFIPTENVKSVSECYLASSPDEKALLEACANVGVIFEGNDDSDAMCIRYIQGSSEQYAVQSSVKHYERLCLLEFSSERKRMSVIVRDENGAIWLYCKGAENSIYSLCSKRNVSRIAKTDEHITEFAKKGLRTLAIGRRQLTEKEFECFFSMFNAANSALENRQQLIDESFAKVENELDLLGATGVEDALQDNVADTLSALQAAGMKIWVLTGDKVETALHIGLACKHVPVNAQLHFLINIRDTEEILRRLESIELECSKTDESSNALVVDGESLKIILTSARDEFRSVALMCKSVLCCRLSPLQKSEVVTLIKKTNKYITAAIGDGANDVSMIQEAHVGIAIMGREGRQATRSADFAIAKFEMLRRLLFVHGHYNSARLAYLILFYCYKNTVISGCIVLYQFYDLYSSTSVFSSLYLWMFDTLYISYSFTYLALVEKPYSEDVLLRFPHLYKNNEHNKQASWWIFVMWMLNATLHIVIIFYFAYFAVNINTVMLGGGQTVDMLSFGTMLITGVVLVGNLKLFIVAHYMTYVNIGFIALGVLSFVISTLIANVEKSNELYGVYNMFLSAFPMWLFAFVTTGACLLTDLAVTAIHGTFFRVRYDGRDAASYKTISA